MSKAAKPDVVIEINGLSDLRTKMMMVWKLVCKAVQVNDSKGPIVIGLGRRKRSNSQNAKLWAMLTDISNQVDSCPEWKEMNEEDWKHVFTGALYGLRFVPGIEKGTSVMLGYHTSNMSKEDFAELIELIYAFGSEQGVRWSDPVMKFYEQISQTRMAA